MRQDDPTPRTAKPVPTTPQARRAMALRDNLRKRKAQAKARAIAKNEDGAR